LADLIAQKQVVLDAWELLKRPITRETALQAALAALDPTLRGQFSKWFEANGEVMLRKLNG
jgi:hypothetical protein